MNVRSVQLMPNGPTRLSTRSLARSLSVKTATPVKKSVPANDPRAGNRRNSTVVRPASTRMLPNGYRNVITVATTPSSPSIAVGTTTSCQMAMPPPIKTVSVS